VRVVEDKATDDPPELAGAGKWPVHPLLSAPDAETGLEGKAADGRCGVHRHRPNAWRAEDLEARGDPRRCGCAPATHR